MNLSLKMGSNVGKHSSRIWGIFQTATTIKNENQMEGGEILTRNRAPQFPWDTAGSYLRNVKSLRMLKVQSAILIEYTFCQIQWITPHGPLAVHSVFAHKKTLYTRGTQLETQKVHSPNFHSVQGPEQWRSKSKNITPTKTFELCTKDDVALFV